MTPTVHRLLVAALCACPDAIAFMRMPAQRTNGSAPTAMTATAAAVALRRAPAEIDGDVRFLSSELLERRTPAARFGPLVANAPAAPTWNADAGSKSGRKTTGATRATP